MDKKISFDVEGFSIIDEYSDSQLAIVEIYVCNAGNNLHNMPIDLDVLKKAKKTLKNKFLVAGFDGDDFEGHEPDEQIVGFFPESSKMKFVEKDDKTFLVAQAIMSKVYADWAYDIFVNENERAVSMEISVLGTEINDDDGLEHITKFVFNGVTLLGKSHQPACEGASASIIKFSKENALEIYSKQFKSSNDIKKNFIDNMKLAKNSGKEDSTMEEKEMETEKVVAEETPAEETKTVEAEVAESVEETAETKECEKKPEDDSDDDSEKDSDKEDDNKASMEKEADDKEDSDKEEDKEDEPKSEKMEVESESLTVEQKYEVFRSAVRETLGCGYLESFDDKYLYFYDYCEMYTYRYAYTLSGTNCTIDADSKTRVMRGGYVEFEKYEENNNKMEAFETEVCELKEKLAAYETAEKEKAVEGILADVVDVLSAERIAELRDNSVNYSLDNLVEFGNEVKAIAFEAVKAKGNKYSFERMPIEQPKQTNKYGW